MARLDGDFSLHAYTKSHTFTGTEAINEEKWLSRKWEKAAFSLFKEIIFLQHAVGKILNSIWRLNMNVQCIDFPVYTFAVVYINLQLPFRPNVWYVLLQLLIFPLCGCQG